eukprot:GHVL01032134.1.p1 GENE.GHVL01032134.1~~GHVL01032134.1.p1  ORF type:complete len:576 (+),score=109.71 GHVL01032134.1:110-1837(+)
MSRVIRFFIIFLLTPVRLYNLRFLKIRSRIPIRSQMPNIPEEDLTPIIPPSGPSEYGGGERARVEVLPNPDELQLDIVESKTNCTAMVSALFSPKATREIWDTSINEMVTRHKRGTNIPIQSEHARKKVAVTLCAERSIKAFILRRPGTRIASNPTMIGGKQQLEHLFEPGAPFFLKLSCEVVPYPEFLEDFNQMHVTVFLTPKGEEDRRMTTRINELLDEYRILKPKYSKVEWGDCISAKIDRVYSKLLDGSMGGPLPEKYQFPTGENVEITIDDSRYIPGLAEGIIGMSPGESRLVTGSISPSYMTGDIVEEDSLSGAQVLFNITDIEVFERSTPDLEGLAERMNTTVSDLTSKIANTVDEEINTEMQIRKVRAVMRSLLHITDVAIPTYAIEDEVETQFAIRTRGWKWNDEDTKRLELKRFRNRVWRACEDKLALTLATSRIFFSENMKISEDELNRQVLENKKKAADERNTSGLVDPTITALLREETNEKIENGMSIDRVDDEGNLEENHKKEIIAQFEEQLRCRHKSLLISQKVLENLKRKCRFEYVYENEKPYIRGVGLQRRTEMPDDD